MAEDLSTLVDAAFLETEFYLPGYVLHRYHDNTSDSSSAATLERTLCREEIWDVGEKVGAGGYGDVHKQQCRNPQQHKPAVRAVKSMPKTRSSEPQWKYRAELKAVVMFSQPEFEPYFVRTFGWFEDATNVYIAMEYLSIGDLQRHKDTLPPFPELEVSRIVRQLLQGVQYMHDNGFAHRDLKPQNILISSPAPFWQIKITDFGISKRALQGVTRLHTMNGTFGYQAPEVLGYRFGGDGSIPNDQALEYTVSVDIWGVGIIALELLVKRNSFLSPGDFAGYIYGRQPLDLSRTEGEQLCEECRDFVKAVLEPDPYVRPTAAAALAHSWLYQAVLESEDTDMSGPGEAYISHSSREGGSTPGPSTNTVIGRGTGSKEFTTALERKFRNLYLDSILLLPEFRKFEFDTTRYYVLRALNVTDVETSAAHGTWTSSNRVKTILDEGFLESGGRVVLFFSVIRSRKLCGVARMDSAVDRDNTDPHWLEDVWKGRFSLTWLTHTEISYDLVKYVPVKESTPNYMAVACVDGTRISPGSAFEILRVYSAEERRETALRLQS